MDMSNLEFANVQIGYVRNGAPVPEGWVPSNVQERYIIWPETDSDYVWVLPEVKDQFVDGYPGVLEYVGEHEMGGAIFKRVPNGRP